MKTLFLPFSYKRFCFVLSHVSVFCAFWTACLEFGFYHNVSTNMLAIKMALCTSGKMNPNPLQVLIIKPEWRHKIISICQMNFLEWMKTAVYS